MAAVVSRFHGSRSWRPHRLSQRGMRFLQGATSAPTRADRLLDGAPASLHRRSRDQAARCAAGSGDQVTDCFYAHTLRKTGRPHGAYRGKGDPCASTAIEIVKQQHQQSGRCFKLPRAATRHHRHNEEQKKGWGGITHLYIHLRTIRPTISG